MGVYGGFVDKCHLVLMNKGLDHESRQMQFGQKYLRTNVITGILTEQLDPSFVVTHHHHSEQAPHAYKIFKERRQLRQGCTQTISRQEARRQEASKYNFPAAVSFHHFTLKLLFWKSILPVPTTHYSLIPL